MMRGTMRVLVLIAALAVLAADISVGCGHGYVYGPVDQKFTRTPDNPGEGWIMVNNLTYSVPVAFYQLVEVGDTVKYDGRNWSIVKRAGSPTPASTP